MLQCNALPVLPELTDPGDADAWGYVHDGEKGVADVLVTDGFDIVRTDSDGAWKMKTSPRAEFVYVIIPRGYEIATHTNGISRYYERIERMEGIPCRADFALRPIGDDTDFSFLVHADPQPFPDAVPDCFSLMSEAYKDMAAEAHRIETEEGFVPLILMLGDVTHEIGYAGYKNALKGISFSVPMFPVPGNHDKELKLGGDAATNRYRETFGPLYYSFNRGNAHFLMLDNVGVTADGNYSREISADQLAWIEKDLSYVDKTTPLIVCGHIPFTRKKSDIKAYQSLLDMVEGYTTVLMSGHLHRSEALERYSDSVEERLHTSLGGDKWRASVARDGTPNGYYIYRFDGTSLSWKFKPLGKDPDKSLFRMYDPEWNQYMDFNPKEYTMVIVDVWDYDEHWSVRWSLEGVDQGDVPRFSEAYDPLAAYNFNSYSGDDARAIKSGHIFHCDVPFTGGRVEVTATDRFGRTMSKSLQLEAGMDAVVSDFGKEEIVCTEIYDMQGRMVYSGAGDPRQGDGMPLSCGCYIMRLHDALGNLSIEKIAITDR